MPNKTTVSIVAVPQMEPLARRVHEIMTEYAHAHEYDVDYKMRGDITKVNMQQFADNTVLPAIAETIRRTEVFVFYTPPLGNPEQGMSGLTKLLNAVHFASPERVYVVIPNFWEGRADRKSKPREAMGAKALANVIQTHGSVKGFFTFNLHAAQIMLAFHIPVDDLPGHILLADYAAAQTGWTPQNIGIVAADSGSIKRSEEFAFHSGFPFMGYVYKKRTSANEVLVSRYIGESVDGLHIISPDDLIDTAGTMIGAGKKVLEEGALSFTVFGTHWLASPKGTKQDEYGRESTSTAEDKFREAGIKAIVTNSIPRVPQYYRDNADFLTCIPCEEMLAKAMIAALTPGDSVSKLSKKNKPKK